jgi:uncharacterized repeat protein (TIGR03803 family)
MMASSIFSRRSLFITTGWLGFCLALAQARGASTLIPLASFNGTNGANPSGGMAWGPDGNLYGTTSAGGSSGDGVVFRVSPGGVFTNLSSFDGTNGSAPAADLLRGADGWLYGTAPTGGTNGDGAVFRTDTNGTIYPLVSFAGTNGAQPRAALSQDTNGILFGTSLIGGSNGVGVAFKLTTNGVLSMLTSFNYAAPNPFGPYGGLVTGTDGFLYGTTFQGGSNGFGAVFKLATNGTITDLYAFTGGTDGSNPHASLTPGQDGALYGTTYYGGTNSLGTIFKVSTNGAFTPLVSFNGTNGAYPAASLMLATDGSLYGTTASGGASAQSPGTGYGTVFKLATNGGFTCLFSFNSTNGANPQAGLAQDAAGNLYGTTTSGGNSGNGTVFKLVLTPPVAPSLLNLTQSGGLLTTIWSAESGQTYQLQSTTNLNSPAWQGVGKPVKATNSSVALPDSVGPDQMRFYRAGVMQ